MLVNALDDARTRHPGEDDFIVLGDLNAGCDYFDEEDSNCPLKGMDYA